MESPSNFRGQYDCYRSRDSNLRPAAWQLRTLKPDKVDIRFASYLVKGAGGYSNNLNTLQAQVLILTS